MDAAWGSESSDQASVAQPVAQTGQVFEQVYVPWEGTLNPRWMRNWAIFRHHVLGIVRKGHRPWGVPTKLVLIFVLIASMTDVALTLLFAVIGEAGLYELGALVETICTVISSDSSHATCSTILSCGLVGWRRYLRGSIKRNQCAVFLQTHQSIRLCWYEVSRCCNHSSVHHHWHPISLLLR